MSNIKYKNNNLFVGGISVKNLTKKNASPFYLYSKENIIMNYNSFYSNFLKVNPLICFSVKSNSNVEILKILKKLGSGADVVSGGELLKALKSGIKPNKIVFSGVGKTEEELRLAIKKRILLINVESENEAVLINKISRNMQKKVSIGVRLNPDIDAPTHKKISTGKAEDKFGLSKKNLITFCKNIKKFKYLKLEALSVHIGSQILNENPFKQTLKVLEEIVLKTKINFKYVDLGGGFGIAYKSSDRRINLKNYSKMVEKFKKKFNCKIIFEPGRSIVGNSAILITKIIYIKKGSKKDFIILDSAMNDLMRPALYGAKHKIMPLKKTKRSSQKNYEFVGPICESTDTFLTVKNFQKLNEKDYLIICDVGAYGMSLASNYNLRPKPLEILIKNSKIQILSKRQKLSELM